MAKALFGHVGVGADPRTVAEVRRLRGRVQELETEVAQLRAANADLLHAIDVERDLMTLSAHQLVHDLTVHEPALT